MIMKRKTICFKFLTDVRKVFPGNTGFFIDKRETSSKIAKREYRNHYDETMAQPHMYAVPQTSRP